ncbi:MAG: hypothetical protein GX815_01360 [Clostridiales bacterium]|nr:hypothetical protein [Clostridiales bacterium]
MNYPKKIAISPGRKSSTVGSREKVYYCGISKRRLLEMEGNILKQIFREVAQRG